MTSTRPDLNPVQQQMSNPNQTRNYFFFQIGLPKPDLIILETVEKHVPIKNNPTRNFFKLLPEPDPMSLSSFHHLLIRLYRLTTLTLKIGDFTRFFTDKINEESMPTPDVQTIIKSQQIKINN